MPASFPAQFVVTVPVSFDSGVRVVSTQFGNGYRQRIIDSVNPDIERPRLRIVVVNDTDANALDAFLKARSVDALLWTPPGGSTPLSYLVEQPFQKTFNGAGLWEFTFSIERVPL